MAVEIPTPPLTATQYAQLKTDVQTVLNENSGTNQEALDMWAVMRGMYYLMENPTPPEDPPPP